MEEIEVQTKEQMTRQTNLAINNEKQATQNQLINENTRITKDSADVLEEILKKIKAIENRQKRIEKRLKEVG
jgi:hypothetical protein